MLPHLGIGIDLERVGGAFHNLIDVGIVEVNPFVLAFFEPGGLLEVSDSPGLLALIEGVGDSDLSAGLKPGSPEIVADLHLAERHRLDVVIAFQFRLLFLGGAQHRAQAEHYQGCCDDREYSLLICHLESTSY